jgi:hypothetical protein
MFCHYLAKKKGILPVKKSNIC